MLIIIRITINLFTASAAAFVGAFVGGAFVGGAGIGFAVLIAAFVCYKIKKKVWSEKLS